MNPLAARLRELRQNEGLTQAAVAETWSVSVGYVTNIENGRELPTPDRIRELADAYGWDARELLALEAAERGRVECAGAPAEAVRRAVDAIEDARG